ncbi:hypothetical protein LJK87_25640 [Paenibacillus sp. P25]|nr:hypothetical protein LJK87_25640 [Paenibacillus sp. P25]
MTDRNDEENRARETGPDGGAVLQRPWPKSIPRPTCKTALWKSWTKTSISTNRRTNPPKVKPAYEA